MIRFKQHGDFKKTRMFFDRCRDVVGASSIYDKYGQMGVDALRAATPKDTGKTSESWDYKVTKLPAGVQIVWTNSNRVNGVPIAIILEYGHATRNGGYVQGIDYINPALTPIFNELADKLWKEVTK